MIEILGKGIYTIREASTLTKLPYHSVNRWVKGYSFKLNGEERKSKSPSVVKVEIPQIDGKFAISFLNLIELLFVKEFMNLGVTLQTIRRASEVASEILDNSHPFAYRRFAIDNKSIFIEIEERTGGRSLVNLAKRQHEIKEFINQYLEEVEFDEFTELAIRWRPKGYDALIVIDPNVAFGKPVIEGTRIGTHTIFKQYQVENSIPRVADWFDISESAVRTAINYEKEELMN